MIRSTSFVRVSLLFTAAVVLCCLALPVTADFDDVQSWATFDPGAHGVGSDPDGYRGAVFDGRYIYFSPDNNGSNYHSEVLRYDTKKEFSDVLSWVAFNPKAHGVGVDADGYHGAVFDGKCIYFIPRYNGSNWYGEVLRYDTTGEFCNIVSWGAFDPGANGIGIDADGYHGAVFDGRYIYLAPHYNGNNYHSEVLRYDTNGDFHSASSWLTFNPGTICNDPGGYMGVVFDSRYIYFVPRYNGSRWSGEVLRYDTTGDFVNVSSWAVFDAGDHGVGTDPDGFLGAVFDGRYVYFTPNYNGHIYHGEVLRYNTKTGFSDVSSWATFDAGANGVGTDPDGYFGAAFDGTYIYFAPHYNGHDIHGEVLRYNINTEFSDVSSWDTFDPGVHGVGVDPDGYSGAVFDGRYIYFAPFYNGEVLRYDTTDSDLVAHWKFDETSGGIASDETGNHHAILHNGPVWDDGILGGGLHFDGVDDYVDPGNIIADWPQGSICIWAKFDSTGIPPHHMVLYGIGKAPFTGYSETAQIYLYGTGQDRPFAFSMYGSGEIDSEVTPELGRWYYVAGTWGPKGVKLYVDGQLAGTDPYTGPLRGSTHNKIGCNSWPRSAFSGAMDDIRIYNRALDEEDVLVLYEEPWSVVKVGLDIKPGSCPNPLNLKSRGVLPVAILGSENFDVNTIDAVSVRLKGVAAVNHSYGDVAGLVADTDDCNCGAVGPDGYVDLTLKFKTEEIVQAIAAEDLRVAHGDVLELELSAEMIDGTLIEGVDCVVIRGKVPEWVGVKMSDSNRDGVVDIRDFANLAEQWLKSYSLDL